MPRQENPDPQSIGDTMNDEMKKQIEQLKTENEDLQRTLRAMRHEITALAADINTIGEDQENTHRLAKAVCELQDELRKSDLDIDIMNTIYAPTMVGGR